MFLIAVQGVPSAGGNAIGNTSEKLNWPGGSLWRPNQEA
jgi:hypothetical protein